VGLRDQIGYTSARLDALVREMNPVAESDRRQQLGLAAQALEGLVHPT
jgi:hypothetical protein